MRKTYLGIFMLLLSLVGQGLSAQLSLPVSGSDTLFCGDTASLCNPGLCLSQYPDNADGFLVLRAEGLASVFLAGSYDLELNGDFLEVYAGIGTGGTLLYSASGQGQFSFQGNPGQTVSLRFRSNAQFNSGGFSLQLRYEGSCICPVFEAVASPPAVCRHQDSYLSIANIPPANYSQEPMGLINYNCSGGSLGPVGDNVVSGTIPIGFDFQYFGQSFDELGISTNGNIQLGSGPYDASPWGAAPIPALGIDNLIALNFADWQTGAAGIIRYELQGFAPFRRFVVCFENLEAVSGTGSLTGRLALMETTNNIELHLNQSSMPGQNRQVQGIQGAAGLGRGSHGRNYGLWAANSSSVRFSPNGQYSWSGPNLNYTSIANPMVYNLTTTSFWAYSLTATVGACQNTDTVQISRLPDPVPVWSRPGGVAQYLICTGDSVTIQVSGGVSYVWRHDGSTADTARVGLSNANDAFAVSVTNAEGCTVITNGFVEAIPEMQTFDAEYCQGDLPRSRPPMQAVYRSTGPTLLQVQDSVSSQSPRFRRPQDFMPGGTCQLAGGPGDSVHYRVLSFNPPYNNFPFWDHYLNVCGLQPQNWDLVLSVYEGSFDPDNPCQNLIRSRNNPGFGCSLGSSFLADLVFGQTYYLVVSGANPQDVGTFELEVLYAFQPVQVQWFTQQYGGSPFAFGEELDPLSLPSLGIPGTDTPGVYTFYVTANSINNVASDSCRQPIRLIVHPRPVIELQGDTLFCAGDSISLQVSGNAHTYRWTTGDTGQYIRVLAEAGRFYGVQGFLGDYIRCSADTGWQLREISPPDIQFWATAPHCAGAATGSLEAMLGAHEGDYQYLWSNGSTGFQIQGLASGLYGLSISMADGRCPRSGSFFLSEPAPIILQARLDSAGSRFAQRELGDSLLFETPFPNPNLQYAWSPPLGLDNPDAPQTLWRAQTLGEQLYLLRAWSGACEAWDSLLVRVVERPEPEPIFLAIPDAFSPDGDGLNERFRPVFAERLDIRRFEVFNRWGQRVYSASSEAWDQGWDGTYLGRPQPRDSYIYVLEFRPLGDRGAYRTWRGELLLLR